MRFLVHRSTRPLGAAVLGFAMMLGLAAAEARELPARGGPVTVAPIAERLIESVVNISTSQFVKGSRGVPLPQMKKGSPFEEFFEDFFNRRGGPGQDRKVSSLGSGFVIDPSGIIVTNNHVIEGADEITINFHDGTKLKVDRVIGRDPKTDLALLKVTPKKPLKAVKFGSSTTLRVGDWVMAIGNPFGLGGTVTLGIISAKARDINSGPYDDFLQTDAAINKGNSGGPLFNMEGEVIGVNTAIISPTGGSIGIGFSVPSETAVMVIEQLKLHGEVRRGWLGVQIQAVTDEIAESLGLSEPTGALVGNITGDGPAAKAGLKTGDVIIRFDGKDVKRSRALPRLVAQTSIGKAVDVEILRKGKRMMLKVVLGRLEDDQSGPGKPDKAPPATSKQGAVSPIPGLTLQLLTDDLRRKYSLEKSMEGVLVVGVQRQRQLRDIKVGDVIVEVQQEKVTTFADITRVVDKFRKMGRTKVLLGLKDGKGDFRFVAVPLR
ncbi:MAG: Do family serine endopeptidase [Hyphomicrobiaceae bacterium]